MFFIYLTIYIFRGRFYFLKSISYKRNYDKNLVNYDKNLVNYDKNLVNYDKNLVNYDKNLVNYDNYLNCRLMRTMMIL